MVKLLTKVLYFAHFNNLSQTNTNNVSVVLLYVVQQFSEEIKK